MTSLCQPRQSKAKARSAKDRARLDQTGLGSWKDQGLVQCSDRQAGARPARVRNWPKLTQLGREPDRVTQVRGPTRSASGPARAKARRHPTTEAVFVSFHSQEICETIFPNAEKMAEPVAYFLPASKVVKIIYWRNTKYGSTVFLALENNLPTKTSYFRKNKNTAPSQD